MRPPELSGFEPWDTGSALDQVQVMALVTKELVTDRK